MIFSSGDEKTPSGVYVRLLGLEEPDPLFSLLISMNLPQRKFVGVQAEKYSLPVSGWDPGANMRIISKRLVLQGFARAHMSGARWGEKRCWGWLVGRMGTLWGCAGSSRGFIESGHLPVGYKGSVCEGSESEPFSPSFLSFPVRKYTNQQNPRRCGLFLLSHVDVLFVSMVLQCSLNSKWHV